MKKKKCLYRTYDRLSKGYSVFRFKFRKRENEKKAAADENTRGRVKALFSDFHNEFNSCV